MAALGRSEKWKRFFSPVVVVVVRPYVRSNASPTRQEKEEEEEKFKVETIESKAKGANMVVPMYSRCTD